MQFETVGQVARDFYVTGTPDVPVYLLDGPQPVLFDAGMTVYARSYVNDIQSVLADRAPAYLFLTHAHFDHIGAAGYFKRVWPDLQVVASARSREILARPNAIKLITALNADAIAQAHMQCDGPWYEQTLIKMHKQSTFGDMATRGLELLLKRLPDKICRKDREVMHCAMIPIAASARTRSKNGLWKNTNRSGPSKTASRSPRATI